MNWQPTLIGSTLRVRPLLEGDFEALYLAASDPLIWEQHHDRERYTLERFKEYFRSGIDSKGAIAVCNLETGKIIGSSRFSDHNPEKSFVVIGFTFLTRENWGGTRNFELKSLMLNYAFQFVESVYFIVSKSNIRSQRAMSKLGGVVVTDVRPAISEDLVFKISKSEWTQKNNVS